MNFRLEGFDDTLSWRGVPLGYICFLQWLFIRIFGRFFHRIIWQFSKNFTNILEDNAFFWKVILQASGHSWRL